MWPNYFAPKFNYLSDPVLCKVWHNSLSQVWSFTTKIKLAIMYVFKQLQEMIECIKN